MPALPLDDAGPYVAGAYMVFLALLLVYVAIMAVRQARIQQEVQEIAQLLETRGAPRPADTSSAPEPVSS